jgi:putative endonuclease
MPFMHEGSYCAYIMASRSHTLYIGVTGDLHKRVFQHKWKEHDGFTARYNCDRLAWFERHGEITRAIAREKELKGWRRAKKIATNPTWIAVARHTKFISLSHSARFSTKKPPFPPCDINHSSL